MQLGLRKILVQVPERILQKPDRDSDDELAICQAAKAGDIAAVRHFICADSGAVHWVDGEGGTAMHCAAGEGHAEVMSALAAAGGDVEAEEGPHRREPRELRSRCGPDRRGTEVTGRCTSRRLGATPRPSRSSWSWVPPWLRRAAEATRLCTSQRRKAMWRRPSCWWKPGLPWTHRTTVAGGLGGKMGWIRLAAGGDTPLHWAARDGHVAVAQLLVEAGAPLDSKDKNGRGPRWEVLGWIGFLAEEVTPDASALRSAPWPCAGGQAAGGSRASTEFEERLTAMHLAAGQGHAKVLSALAKAGADVPRLPVTVDLSHLEHLERLAVDQRCLVRCYFLMIVQANVNRFAFLSVRRVVYSAVAVMEFHILKSR
eukprot:Skav225253  [mRNA]  locus=scaffold988:92587:99856:- [translate_table: standard]